MALHSTNHMLTSYWQLLFKCQLTSRCSLPYSMQINLLSTKPEGVFSNHLPFPPPVATHPFVWSHWALQLSEGKLTVAFLHCLFMLCLCLATVFQPYSSSLLIVLSWLFSTVWSASASHRCHNALSRLLWWPFTNGHQAVAASSSTFYQCLEQGLQ